MKYLFSVFVLLSFSSVNLYSQTDYQFIELFGAEDTLGTTHLYYTIESRRMVSCTQNENKESYVDLDRLVHHFDFSTLADSVFIKNYSFLAPNSCYDADGGIYISDFAPFDGNPNNALFSGGSSDGFEPYGYVQVGSYQGYLHPLFGYFPKIHAKSSLGNNFYVYYGSFDLGTLEIPITDDKDLINRLNYGLFEPDTLLNLIDVFDVEIFEFSPFSDSVSFIIGDNGKILRSDDFTSTEFESVLLPDLPTYYYNEVPNKTKYEFLFDSDSLHVYYLEYNKLFRSNNYGHKNSWEEILTDVEINHLVTDNIKSGNIYYSDSTNVYFSDDFGEKFNPLISFNSEITGLYKKPNSEILYVLTRTDLYKVENGQPTSIKQVPVSNEQNPDIPTSVTLKQNYPNPFNPTTTIQFELDKTTFTKLTVYDVLGRKVRELVNDVRPAGTNTIQFDATNLASGVYLYRLEANGVVQTKRLTLIK